MVPSDEEIIVLVNSLLYKELNKQDLDQLRIVLRQLDEKYYANSASIVSDQHYDTLFFKLKDLENRFPELITSDSPTQKLAPITTQGFTTVAHTVPMLSLSNSYNAEDLIQFEESLEKLTVNAALTYCVEPKFDGASIALVYENDLLVRAATRGNGVEGDDITANAKQIKNIPIEVPFSSMGIYKIELRGEVVIENIAFEQMNKERETAGLKLFQNSRNTASGSLRMKDPMEVAKRRLEAFIYQIGYASNRDGENVLESIFPSQFEAINLLGKLGFQVPLEEKARLPSIEAVVDFCLEWEERRNHYNYEIDGMVVKLDATDLQKAIGATGHHPRWAIAFKFKARKETTQLLQVQYQVGRTGAVTPVAKLDPVKLAGVTVSSVSLHNADFIAQKDIQLGDFVIVERAGDVIPYISGVSLDQRKDTSPIVFPSHCPSCETLLTKPEDEAIWRCENAECPAQSEERIIHFVSKGAMDIEGLGKDIVKRFMEVGILSNIEDIYKIDYDKVEALEGWKSKSRENLEKGIEASKNQPIWRLIVALGIRHIGSITAKLLAKQIQHLKDFQNWDVVQLEELEDVGPKVAESIYQFYRNPENLLLIEKLAASGVKVEKTEEDTRLDSDKLSGKTFLFTGTLTQFSRDQAKEMVEANAGKNISGVSVKLDYLVIGAKAGSKLAKAEKINEKAAAKGEVPPITIISETAFLEML